MLEQLAAGIVQTIHDTLENQDLFRMVVGGGRTQEELNSRIVNLNQPSQDWQRVLIFLADERCVPHDHEQSNYRMNMDTLLKPLNLSADT